MEYRNIALAIAALALLTACPEPGNGDGPVEPQPIRVEVEAAVDRNGNVAIEKQHHDTAVLGPGQRVEWACRCPEGLEFTVMDLRPFLDLDRLSYLDLAALERALDPGTEMPAEEGIGVLEALAPVLLSQQGASEHPTDEAQGQEQEVAARPMYGKGWSSGIPPGAYTEGTFVSPPVPRGTGLIVWKFTWRVRQKGDSSQCRSEDPGCDEWDPHIVTYSDQ